MHRPIDHPLGILALDGRLGRERDLIAAVELELSAEASEPVRVAGYLRQLSQSDFLASSAARALVREQALPLAQEAVLSKRYALRPELPWLPLWPTGHVHLPLRSGVSDGLRTVMRTRR